MPPYPMITLRTGDRGDQVRQLQALLNRDYPAYSTLVICHEDGTTELP
jgi:peptidoglycan hydrolase-like protein with peptidoglycan-binding domain